MRYMDIATVASTGQKSTTSVSTQTKHSALRIIVRLIIAALYEFNGDIGDDKNG